MNTQSAPAPSAELLPDKLRAGDRIESKKGVRARVIRTRKTDEYDEPYYRLFYLATRVRSDRLWTRDELVTAGCKYLGYQPVRVEEGCVDEDSDSSGDAEVCTVGRSGGMGVS